MSATWDKRAKLYDLLEGSDLRRGPAKSALFQQMAGRVLFVAVGTGLDIRHFPPGREIVGIDISDDMLRRAAPRRQSYSGTLSFVRADALNLCFANASFDAVVTSCTMCSVPDATQALRELYRVLRPGGRLLMFEHMRSRNPILGLVLDLMTVFTRRRGTEMNRDTLGNTIAAGFRITRVESVFLDIILSIHGVKDGAMDGTVQNAGDRIALESDQSAYSRPTFEGSKPVGQGPAPEVRKQSTLLREEGPRLR